MATRSSFPTVLIAVDHGELRSFLARAFEQEGYLVLEAEDPADVYEIARIHSRHIHLMLVEDAIEGRSLAETVKLYRPDTEVFFLARGQDQTAEASLLPELALARARQLVKRAALSDGAAVNTVLRPARPRKTA